MSSLNMIQNLFDNFMKDKLRVERVITEAVKDKLAEQDISITEKQFNKIEKRIKDWNDSVLSSNETQTTQSISNLRFDDIFKDDVYIALDFETDIKTIFDITSEALIDSIPKTSRDIAKATLITLKKNFPSHQRQHNKENKHLTKNIKKVWGPAIDLLEMFQLISLESANSFNLLHGETADKESYYVFNTLSRLHARGCQILAEIIVLLRNGFADGAHARWRSLHEISVIAYFISEHGNNTAQRYLSHNVIETYKASLKYQRHCKVLGYEPLTEVELKETKDAYDSMLGLYGKDFKYPYGWASSALNVTKPNFADIEADVGLEHMRPHYQMASHNVHANPKGVFFKLGLLPETEDILLAGPSNIGFADPAHCAAISLLQITVTLLSTKTNLDVLVILDILVMLEKEIGNAFLESQETFEN